MESFERDMIARKPTLRQVPAWQRQVAEALRDPAELLDILELDRALLEPAREAARRFPLRVPRRYLAKIRRRDPGDPLLRQILPLAAEGETVAGYGPDPVGDRAARTAPGVLQKYRGRALVVTTGACAVHCRYCFRREYPYGEDHAGGSQWPAALDQLAADSSLREVILSGGDPLSLSDRRLAQMLQDLGTIGHLQRIRLHTRLPVVIPERITSAFTALLTRSPLPVVLVLHANHPRELDGALAAPLQTLRTAGVTLLNQSVLLRGVNDCATTLEALSERLFTLGVLPYYLHLLDPVAGTAHFAVDDARGRQLAEELGARLPGYLVPKLVREHAGAPAKTPMATATAHVL